jgi:hypothetical protein
MANRRNVTGARAALAATMFLGVWLSIAAVGAWGSENAGGNCTVQGSDPEAAWISGVAADLCRKHDATASAIAYTVLSGPAIVAGSKAADDGGLMKLAVAKATAQDVGVLWLASMEDGLACEERLKAVGHLVAADPDNRSAWIAKAYVLSQCKPDVSEMVAASAAGLHAKRFHDYGFDLVRAAAAALKNRPVTADLIARSKSNDTRELFIFRFILQTTWATVSARSGQGLGLLNEACRVQQSDPAAQWAQFCELAKDKSVRGDSYATDADDIGEAGSPAAIYEAIKDAAKTGGAVTSQALDLLSKSSNEKTFVQAVKALTHSKP